MQPQPPSQAPVEPKRLLLMDDEPTSTLISHAERRIRAAGYNVDLVTTMGEAIAAFHRHYYDLIILDIDMSQSSDPSAGDGVTVLQQLMALYHQSQVVLFSGAGTVAHWFAASSAHCAGYVAKDESGQDAAGAPQDSIDRLLQSIARALDSEPPARRDTGPMPPTLLLAGNDPALRSDVQAQLAQSGLAISDYSLDEAAALSDETLATFGVVLLLQHEFNTRQRTRQALARLLSLSPHPHVIAGCDGRNELRDSILYLANQRPFRLINLSQTNWPDQLQAAVSEAQIWYGRAEIVATHADALRRVEITLPADYLAAWSSEGESSDVE